MHDCNEVVSDKEPQWLLERVELRLFTREVVHITTPPNKESQFS